MPELTRQFQTITLNFKAAKVRHDRMNGRDHLVVPCVMMTEGVHDGSEGPLLYTEEELKINTRLWNNKPVVVYHPVRNGAPVSACDPDIIDRYGVGVLMNTRWEKDGLRTECWIEEEKAEQVDNRVLEALNSEQMMEVSTGLFMDVESKEGEWNGEKYHGIALNHLPDHLALLPDKKGACSIEDGAGLLRNAAKNKDPKSKLAAHYLEIVNELSATDLYNKLSDLVQEADADQIPGTYVVDVWDPFFIYHDPKGGVWYQKYKTENDEVKLEGTRQAAEKDTRYKLADGTYVGNVRAANKETAMNEKERKALADKAISNAKSPWTEDDREDLLKMADNHLEWVANAMEPMEKPEGEGEGKPKAPKAEPKVETTKETATANTEPTVDEYIEQAPEGMRDMLRQGIASHVAEKDGMVKKIMANARNTFTQEQLDAKDMSELKGIAMLAEVPTAPLAPPAPHFAGQAPVTAASGNEEEPLVAPALNFETKTE